MRRRIAAESAFRRNDLGIQHYHGKSPSSPTWSQPRLRHALPAICATTLGRRAFRCSIIFQLGAALLCISTTALELSQQKLMEKPVRRKNSKSKPLLRRAAPNRGPFRLSPSNPGLPVLSLIRPIQRMSFQELIPLATSGASTDDRVGDIVG